MSWTTEVRFSVGTRIFSLRHGVQTVSGVHTASQPAVTGDEATGREANNLPHLMPRLRMRGAIPQLTISFHGVVLS
jgi:hypothetical protein